MRHVTAVGVGFLSMLVVLGIGAAGFVGSGLYNIGADDHHTRPVLWIIEHLRNRSVAIRSRDLQVPALDDHERVVRGANRYATLCTGCHLAPGVDRSVLRAGLYPHPPNLVQQDLSNPQTAFWTIKHGIKMSAMPAWGKTLDDTAVWDLVAFIRQMPAMSPELYRALIAGSQTQARAAE